MNMDSNINFDVNTLMLASRATQCHWGPQYVY